MKTLMSILLGLAATGAAWSQTLYENNFEKAPPGKVPDDMLVLDGQFAVQEEGSGRFLELPGAPLETYGVLFGPTEGAGVCATASFLGTGKGRRYPVFGLGLNGVGGYKLQVAPAKGELELFKGEERVAAAAFAWKSGEWTRLRLQVRPSGDGAWQVEGKAWLAAASEPAAWAISFREKAEPVAGRASLWGSPFSGQPIRFDNLGLTRVK